MDTNQPPRSSRQAPLVQASLAALVAGSLLMFATIAFRTGFFDDDPSGVRAVATTPRPPRPVVLPAASVAPEPEVAARRQQPAPEIIRIAEVAPDTDVVLETRTDESDDRTDRHRRTRGKGHDKDKGRGHDKDKERGKNHPGNKTPDEAKEDEDDDGEVHAAADDDESDDDSDRGRGSGGSAGSGGGSGDSGGGSGDSNG